MSGNIVAKRKLLFLLADDQDRTYYVQGGVVMPPTSDPVWLKESPDNWKDLTLKWDTNQKYFSTIRSLSTALKFVKDGQLILADRLLNGKGTEEVVYLIILRSNPAKGLNYYELEYKSRLDLSKFSGDPRTGISVNALQDDVFALVQAKESEIYPIPCNASNPKAVKVLFDGTLLQDKINYSVIHAPLIANNSPNFWFAIPMAYFNNEGDSVGATFGDQNYDTFSNALTYVHYSANGNNFLSFQEPTTVYLKGTFSFDWSIQHTTTSGGVMMLFMTSNDTAEDTNKIVFDNGFHGPHFDLVPGKTYTVDVNIKINLAANEKLFFLALITASALNNFTITPNSTIMSATFTTKADPSIAYAIRPLDVAQSLVSQITNGKYSVQSEFLSSNNRKVAISGSSLRSFPDAVIMTNWSDFFKSYFVPYNLGLTVRKGIMYIEPLDDLYNSLNELIDLGDISEVKLTIAEDLVYTSAKVGYVKQTYNKRNGRYEFNCTHTYKFPIYTVLNTLDLVSPYRADSFGMEFIRTGYPNLNSTDDKGDSDVFTVMISDVVGQTEGEVSTAVIVNIETLIVAAPVIKTPYSNSVVHNNHPTITGISQAGKIITVYVNGEIDGTTAADGSGNWTYDIQRTLDSVSTTFNGIYSVSCDARTDDINISGQSMVLTLQVNTSQQAAFLITGPSSGDSLYNNLPEIHGTAPSGKVITISVDGGTLAMVVTNNSGYWKFQTVTPLADGSRNITATAPGLADAPAVAVSINTNISSPLITSILYGDTLFTNQPTIRGVAIPGTVVSVYLDGGGGPVVAGVAGPLGTVTADAHGDWSYHVTSVVDANNITTYHVPDGQHVFSTTPTPVSVQASIAGFRLMRGMNKGPVPDFDSIKLDDAYIPPGIDPATLPPTLGQFLHPETLYNYVETSPLQALRAHDSVLASFLEQQVGEQIVFNGAEVNANMVTKKDGVIRNEGQNIDISDLPMPPLYHKFYLSFKAPISNTFNDIMTGLDNDGYIAVNYKGLDIFLLPLGNMSMKPATDDAQSWKLLVSGKTPLSTLFKLFANGMTFNLGKNMIHFSDANPLHKVKYSFTPAPGYHFSDIYDDFQKHRFGRWVYQPDFAQPFEYGDVIVEQAVTNGVGTAQYHMISVVTGKIVDVFPFSPVVGSVVSLPNVLQQCVINLTNTYPQGQYWFGLFIDGQYVAITEKIDLRSDWPNTMKLEYGGSADLIDYYLSTGIQPMIRVPGMLLPWKPESEVDIYEDELGDFEITRGIPLRVRDIQFGDEVSLIPDWMGLKLNQITLLTNLRIESTRYTRNANSKMDNQDLGKGVPEMLIKMEMILGTNQTGVSFSTPGDGGINSVTYTLDATAFGRNSGVINVTANEE